MSVSFPPPFSLAVFHIILQFFVCVWYLWTLTEVLQTSVFVQTSTTCMSFLLLNILTFFFFVCDYSAYFPRKIFAIWKRNSHMMVLLSTLIHLVTFSMCSSVSDLRGSKSLICMVLPIIEDMNNVWKILRSCLILLGNSASGIVLELSCEIADEINAQFLYSFSSWNTIYYQSRERFPC